MVKLVVQLVLAPRIILMHELSVCLLAKMMPSFSRWPEKRLGSNLVLVILHHAQQDFDMIL